MANKPKSSAAATSETTSKVSDRDISDAYLYLLGRLLVLRQEHLDFRDGGFEWNELVHREPGRVSWANPNLDVAYSEAWIAVDEHSSTLIEIPDIVGRYYTVQILNPWGETIANINERTYQNHAAGPFLICLKGAKVSLPTGTERIDVPGPKARVLVRVALGMDHDEATKLQHEIEMDATGSPVVDPPVSIPLFTNDALPGAEAFETAPAILAVEPDVNPGMGVMQAKVKGVAAAAANPDERRRIDDVIRKHAWPALKEYMATMGTSQNGWMKPRMAGNYGDDWLARTTTNLMGIWANNQAEAVYFANGNASPLDGSATYKMTFAKDNLPDSHVRYFWSVTCVDAKSFRVIPNPANRFVLNRHTVELGKDGSLTLYFAPEKPADAPEGNWLPTPAGQNYLLTWRSYGPDQGTVSGNWFPPALERLRESVLQKP